MSQRERPELADPTIRLANWLHGDGSSEAATAHESATARLARLRAAAGGAKKGDAALAPTAKAAADRAAAKDADVRGRTSSFDGSADALARLQRTLIDSIVDAAPEVGAMSRPRRDDAAARRHGLCRPGIEWHANRTTADGRRDGTHHADDCVKPDIGGRATRQTTHHADDSASRVRGGGALRPCVFSSLAPPPVPPRALGQDVGLG
jgi:hypothetical protein